MQKKIKVKFIYFYNEQKNIREYFYFKHAKKFIKIRLKTGFLAVQNIYRFYKHKFY